MNPQSLSIIGPLDTAEARPVYFPFNREMSSSTNIVSAEIEINVISGTDEDPNGMIVGVPLIDNNQKMVQQKIKGEGRNGNTYNVRCIATDSLGNNLTVAAILPVVFLVTGP